MGKKRKLGAQGSHNFPDTIKKKKPNPGGPSTAPPNRNRKKNNNNNNKDSGGGGDGGGAKKEQQKQYHQNQEPVIPFSPEDSILLVGEGDLSFAASLAIHHRCRNLTATVLEKNEAELLEKYPHAAANIAAITGCAAVPNKSSTRKSETKGSGDNDADSDSDKAGDGNEGAQSKDDDDDDDDGEQAATLPTSNNNNNNNKILYNADVRTMKPFTKRTTTTTTTTTTTSATHHTPTQQKQGAFKRILFNFPHVGGKSTDRNRQVRYNQELLVSFFCSALPSLSPGGTVVVTLFEGDPYTLWNVKDLGRHAGLESLQSFRFHPHAYPGYRHARTLGVVRDRRSGEASGAAWRGEERAARSYVFMRKGEAPDALPVSKKKKRRNGGDESSSSDEDSGEEEPDFEGYDD